MSEGAFGKAKEQVTLLLLLYPIAVGLYAVGFFWDLPRDIISYFDVVPFFFKASIVYLSTAVFIIVSLLIATIIYGPILRFNARLEIGPLPVDDTRIDGEVWAKMSKLRRFVIVIAGTGIVAIILTVAWIDPPPFATAPERFVTILGAVFFIGVVARPFVKKEDWKSGVLLFFLTFALVLPVAAGNGDAQVDENDPRLSVGKESCPIIFATSETIIAKCVRSVAVLPKDSKTPLLWRTG